MSEQNQVSQGPWRFIRLDQFRLPPEPTRERMRRGLLGVWDKLRLSRSAAEPATVEMDLKTMPSDLLAEAAPSPDWGAGVSALHDVLEDWWKERAGKVQIVVGAPYSGTAEIVSEWASVFQCPILADPPLEQIKSGGSQWLEEIDQYPDRVWVIPRLERCYLRHSQGFTLLRALLDKITTFSSRFLLACDSWAWTYLSKALHIDALFPMPLVGEAFSHEKLDRWFGELAAHAPEKTFIFRQANNKNLVLRTVQKVQAEGEQNEDITDFLPRLASYSRGIPGVAYTIWRYSLRIAQNKKNQEESEVAPSDNDGPQQTIWVEPWSALKFPSLSGIGSRDRDLFILHTLLLHNGLSSEVLADILPFSESQIKSILQVFRVAGIVVNDQDNWRVAPSAYPAVRGFFQYEGYMVDAL